MLKKRSGLIVSLGIIIFAGFMSCDNGNGPSPVTKPLELVSPKGGESYKVGDTVAIQWKINDANKILSVRLRLSLDNGKSFLDADLQPSSSIYAPTVSFKWVPTGDQISNQCVIRVMEYDKTELNDQSGTFTVSN